MKTMENQNNFNLNKQKGCFQVSRSLFESDIWVQKPAWWIKIWVYILGRVNHQDNNQFKRGGCFITYDEIYLNCKLKNDGVAFNSVHNVIRYLKSSHRITTQKTTRGMLLNVLNYNLYQTINNYKNHTEKLEKTTEEPQTNHTINKNEKNDNSLTIVSESNTPKKQATEFFNNTTKQLEVQEWLVSKGVPPDVAQREISKFVGYWTELDQTGRKQRWQAQKFFDLKRRFVTWFGKIAQFNNNKPASGGRKRNVI